MPKRIPMTDEERQKILDDRASGMTIDDIRNKHKRAFETIKNICAEGQAAVAMVHNPEKALVHIPKTKQRGRPRKERVDEMAILNDHLANSVSHVLAGPLEVFITACRRRMPSLANININLDNGDVLGFTAPQQIQFVVGGGK